MIHQTTKVTDIYIYIYIYSYIYKICTVLYHIVPIENYNLGKIIDLYNFDRL